MHKTQMGQAQMAQMRLSVADAPPADDATHVVPSSAFRSLIN